MIKASLVAVDSSAHARAARVLVWVMSLLLVLSPMVMVSYTKRKA